jgi:hypothetical protein
MSSHSIPPGDLSNRIANLRKKVGATLKAREDRLSKEKKPELPNFNKKLKEEKDHEHSMAREEVYKMQKSLTILHKKLKGEGNLAAWVQSKLTRAADYLEDISNHLDSGEHNIEEEYEDDNTPELRSKTVTDASSSSKPTRRSRVSSGALSRMLNPEGSTKPKKKKKSEMTEEVMTPKQKEQEAKLKQKYDDSEMKQNMIDQYGKEKGTQIYFAKIRKMAMEELEQVEDYLEERKLSRTSRRATRVGKPGYDAEGKPKPKGKVRAWDMDETLMRNDPKKIRVHVKDKEGKKVQSLTNQEFNTHKLDKDKGHSYDFDEFRSSEKFSKAATPNKSMVKKLKKQVRRGKPVHIVTARGSFDDQPKFAKHLRRHGIEIDPGKGKGGRHVHVHRAGDMEGSDIGEKKVKIVKGLMKKHGTSGAEMYDDAAKVHRAFKTSAKETPTQPKVKTKMVQPEIKTKIVQAKVKSKIKTKMKQPGKTQARSFREDIDLDLIYDFILEQLVLEEISENLEEASELLETFNDELIADLIQESYEMIETLMEGVDDETSGKINYISPYKKLQEKKEIKEKYMVEENEVTPYEYWKSFIGDEDAEDMNSAVIENFEETTELDEEVPMNSYQKWKSLLSSNEKSS